MAQGEGVRSVRRLELRVERRRRSEVAIFIDNVDLMTLTGSRAFASWTPAALLDPDIAPLMPADPVRRVAVYLCTCGIAGCGCVAPVIDKAGGRVIWSDFRDFTGDYDAPVIGYLPAGGEVLPIPDLAFDAGQYRAEVERAMSDRWWETPALKTVRILRRALDDARDHFDALGWTRQYVWATRSPGSYEVTFLDADHHQICVELAARSGPPRAQARELGQFLTATPPSLWPVFHCSFCDGSFTPSPGQSLADRDQAAARHPAHAPSRPRARYRTTPNS